MNIILVPIAFFAFLAVVLLVPHWLRYRAHRAALQVVSEAAAKGHTPDSMLVERLLTKPRPAVGKWFTLLNLLLGVGALSVGMALTVSSYLLHDRAGGSTIDSSPIVGGLMNLCIGAGLITLGLFSLRWFSGRSRPSPQWDYAAILALVCLFLGASGISIATGLTLSAQIFVEPRQGARAATEMLTGALVNACSGIGFVVLGIGIFRWFAAWDDAKHSEDAKP